MVDDDGRTWHEIFRSVPAVPLTADGDELAELEMLATGLEVTVVEEREGRLLLESRGSTPDSQWQYRVERTAFEEAITPPDGLPREGAAPTSSESGAPA